MDIHNVPGVKSGNVAEAHLQDLIHQQNFGCNCMTYWIDEMRETIFCLIEAPDKDAVKEMHSKAHGLVPHKIIEVSSAIIQSFLGRIYDPDDVTMENGMKVFTDPAYRLLLVTSTEDHALLRHTLGPAKAGELLHMLNHVMRRNIQLHKGSEAEHAGEGFLVSFASASDAIACTLDIQKDLPPDVANALDFRMALSGGEPVEKSNKLFGDTISRGNHLCALASPSRIAIAGKIKELVSKELLQLKKNSLLMLSLPDEDFLNGLFTHLEEQFHEPGFDVPEYALAMSMSTPQFYRKTTGLTGKSCNALLKEFRLKKALDLLKTQRYSVSQVTFDTGFTSPSYFTKCFKTRYGLLPMEYLELLKQA